MVISRYLLTSALLLGGGLVSPALAQEADASRVHLDKILGVLRLHTEAAGPSCLAAMKQVHETEEAVKAHQDDARNKADLSVAQDVLDSDYQNGAQICGADAARLCRETTDPRVSGACRALQGSDAPG